MKGMAEMDSSLRKILYVEDEPDIQTIARICLEQLGHYDVVICSSGQEALDKIAHIQPDLILLDVMMPEMDGMEVLKRLRESGPCQTTPVIFMTARTQDHERENYLQQGALGVIQKPFDPMGLPGQIQTIWTTFHREKTGE